MERYCVSSGARSISDLARSAICGMLDRANEANALAVTVQKQTALVKNLEGKIEQLTAEIGLLKAEKRPRGVHRTVGGQKIPDEIETES